MLEAAKIIIYNVKNINNPKVMTINKLLYFIQVLGKLLFNTTIMLITTAKILTNIKITFENLY